MIVIYFNLYESVKKCIGVYRLQFDSHTHWLTFFRLPQRGGRVIPIPNCSIFYTGLWIVTCAYDIFVWFYHNIAINNKHNFMQKAKQPVWTRALVRKHILVPWKWILQIIRNVRKKPKTWYYIRKLTKLKWCSFYNLKFATRRLLPQLHPTSGDAPELIGYSALIETLCNTRWALSTLYGIE